MASLDAWTVEYCTVRRVPVEYLAFEDSTVFERQVKHVTARGVRHRIEAHNGHRAVDVVKAVSDAAHVAMTTIETPHSAERLALRQFRHT